MLVLKTESEGQWEEHWNEQRLLEAPPIVRKKSFQISGMTEKARGLDFSFDKKK